MKSTILLVLKGGLLMSNALNLCVAITLCSYTLCLKSEVANAGAPGRTRSEDYEGQYVSHFTNGQIEMTGSFHKGWRTNSWVWNYENGETAAVGRFGAAGGYPESRLGKWKWFHSNGNIWIQGEYDDNGRASGRWVQRYRYGAIAGESCYAKGRCIKSRYYYTNGTLRAAMNSISNENDEVMAVRLYDRGGSLSRECYFVGRQIRTGQWKWFGDKGIMYRRYAFENNRPTRVWEWADDGVIRFSGKYYSFLRSPQNYDHVGYLSGVGTTTRERLRPGVTLEEVEGWCGAAHPTPLPLVGFGVDNRSYVLLGLSREYAKRAVSDTIPRPEIDVMPFSYFLFNEQCAVELEVRLYMLWPAMVLVDTEYIPITEESSCYGPR